MKRWTLRIVLLLVLGCVTTVAVAWGCATSRVTSLDTLDLAKWTETHWISAWVLPVVGGTRIKLDVYALDVDPVVRTDTLKEHVPSWLLREAESSTAMHREFITFAYGWPTLSLRADFAQAEQFQPRRIDGPTHIVLTESANPWLPRTRVLPLRPVWPGFIIDTLFYGMIWFGIFFGFGSARRARRKKRGRCPKCAYQLRGQFDAGCSECGWNRSEDDV